jgi:hypothetical protein
MKSVGYVHQVKPKRDCHQPRREDCQSQSGKKKLAWDNSFFLGSHDCFIEGRQYLKACKICVDSQKSS